MVAVKRRAGRRRHRRNSASFLEQKRQCGNFGALLFEFDLLVAQAVFGLVEFAHRVLQLFDQLSHLVLLFRELRCRRVDALDCLDHHRTGFRDELTPLFGEGKARVLELLLLLPDELLLFVVLRLKLDRDLIEQPQYLGAHLVMHRRKRRR